MTCNTALIAKSSYSFVMNLSDRVFKVFELIGEQRLSGKAMNPHKFIVMEGDDGAVVGSRVNKELENRFGGYDAFGQDTRLVEPDMIVKNLKCNRVEIREKIFVDKPVAKQLEVTLEEVRELNKKEKGKDGKTV